MTILDRIKIAIINAAYRIRRNTPTRCVICDQVILVRDAHYIGDDDDINNGLCHVCWVTIYDWSLGYES